MALIWDENQRAIFDEVANGTGHVVINAVAGSGKTTTIVEAIKYVRPSHRVLYLAFARENMLDLNASLAGRQNVDVLTTHSYGRRAVVRSRGRLARSPDRMRLLIRELASDLASPFEYQSALITTVEHAKNTFAQTAEEIDAVIDKFGVDAGTDDLRERFIEDVIKLLERSKDTRDGLMTFEDMIWLPVVKKMSQAKYDRVFIDETQDLNLTQIHLVLRAVKDGGRIVAVGDPNQSIYRFRGADENAFERVKEKLGALELPLSFSYRCCRAVVREAEKIVPRIEAWPRAEEGVVRRCTLDDLECDAAPGDLIVSRSNAPLVSLCYQFLREGIPAHIMGKDIGQGLLALIKKMRANSVEGLRASIQMWLKAEHDRLVAQGSDVQHAWDRARCVITISQGAKRVDDVVQRVQRLFNDVKNDEDRIVLGTTHKAKGKERDRVWMLEPTYRLRSGIEEENLYYVAVTRAKSRLFIVTDYPNYKRNDEEWRLFGEGVDDEY